MKGKAHLAIHEDHVEGPLFERGVGFLFDQLPRDASHSPETPERGGSTGALSGKVGEHELSSLKAVIYTLHSGAEPQQSSLSESLQNRVIFRYKNVHSFEGIGRAHNVRFPGPDPRKRPHFRTGTVPALNQSLRLRNGSIR